MTEREPQPTEKIRAVIVDDLGYWPEWIFARNGIDVVARFSSIDSSEEGINEFLEEKPFDVVLVHITHKANERGREFATRLKKIRPNIYIISCSGDFQMQRWADTHFIKIRTNNQQMIEAIKEGVASRRNKAGRLTSEA